MRRKFSVETLDGRKLTLTAESAEDAVEAAKIWEKENPIEDQYAGADPSLMSRANRDAMRLAEYRGEQPTSSLDYQARVEEEANRFAKALPFGAPSAVTGLAEFAPGRVGEVAASASDALQRMAKEYGGSQAGFKAGQIGASMVPAAGAARLTGAVLSKAPQALKNIPFISSAGRMVGEGLKGAAGGAVVGASTPVGSVDDRIGEKLQNVSTDALIGGGLGLLGGAGGEAIKYFGGGKLPSFFRDMMAGTSAKTYKRAQDLRERAEAAGVKLTAPEAIQAAIGTPTNIGALESVVAQSTPGGAIMQQLYAGRPRDIARAATNVISNISPQRNPYELTLEAQRLSGPIRNIESSFREPGGTAYREALKEKTVSPAVVEDLITKAREIIAEDKSGKIIAPKFKKFIKLLTDQKAKPASVTRETLPGSGKTRVFKTTPAIEARPQTDANTLNIIQKQFSDFKSKQLEGLSRLAAGPMKRLLGEFDDSLKANVAGLKEAAALYEKGARRSDLFAATPSGQVGRAKNLADVQEQLMPRVPMAGQQREIKKAAQLMGGVGSPELPRAVIAQALRDTANRTLKKAGRAGELQQYGGALFAKEIAANPQSFANLVSALRGAGALTKPIKELLRAYRATGYRQPIGSPTYGRQQLMEELSDLPGIQGVVTQPLGFAAKAATKATTDRAMRELAEIFVSPNGIAKIQALAARNDAAGEAARRFLAMQRAATNVGIAANN